jgi:ribonuclease PH
MARLPAVVPVAAVSVGVLKGQVIVDLDYTEDSTGEVDLNLVALAGGKLVEVQGTAEHGSFDRAQLDAMVDAGLAAIALLVEKQRALVG